MISTAANVPENETADPGGDRSIVQHSTGSFVAPDILHHRRLLAKSRAPPGICDTESCEYSAMDDQDRQIHVQLVTVRITNFNVGIIARCTYYT